MGIKFRCQSCDKKLHVKAFLAGKRGVCPQCGAKVRIPLASEDPETSSAGGTSEPRKEANAQSTKAVRTNPSTSTAATKSPAPSATKQSGVTQSEVAEVEREADPISEAPEAVWYVRPPTGGQYGPADGDTMRRWLEEGRVSADSLIWREGWDDWKTGDTIFPSLRATPSPIETAIASDAVEAVPQDEFAFGDKAARPRHANARAGAKSRNRNVAIVVSLSIVCVGLLIALLFVLKNQG